MIASTYAAATGIWGNIPAWVAAGAAVAALSFALAAWRTQSRQLRTQQKQLNNQRKANRKQGAVLAAELRGLVRQQAEKVRIIPDAVRGLKCDTLPDITVSQPVTLAVDNHWHRPMWDVAARYHPKTDREPGPAVAFALQVREGIGPDFRHGSLVGQARGLYHHVRRGWVTHQKGCGDKVRKILPGERCAFVWNLEKPDPSPSAGPGGDGSPSAVNPAADAPRRGGFHVRFMDDAYNLWEIYPDLGLKELDNRNDW